MVIALVLARGWSAERSAGPSSLVSHGDAANETPVITPTASVAAPTVTAAAVQVPDWVLNADPKRIEVISVPDETQLLTGYDLLIDQELDFTLSPLWTVEDDAVCEAIWLDWGDGLGEDLPCRSPRAAQPETRTESRYPLKHRYLQAGAFRPQVWMRQRPDAVLTGPAADFLVLDRHASQGPRPAAGGSPEVTLIPDRDLVLTLVLLTGMLLLFLWLTLGLKASPAWLKKVPAWIPGLLALGLSVTLLLDRGQVIGRDAIEPLIGRRGLDPLRPDADLVHVTSSVGRSAGRGSLRLSFADGQERVAEPPALAVRSKTLHTEYGEIVPQHEDALGRMRAVHAPLSLPFADQRRDGIVLDMPEALPRDPSADEALVFEEAWYRGACLSEGNIIPSPDERSVIIPRRFAGALRIHRLDLASGAMAMAHPLVRDFAWSPDSRWVVSRGADARGPEDSATANGQAAATLSLRDADRLDPQGSLDLEQESGYGVNDDGIWLARADGVWRVDWPSAPSPKGLAPKDGSKAVAGMASLLSHPQRIFGWPAELAYRPLAVHRWIAPAPDGRTIAYGCLSGTCLVDHKGVPVALVRSGFDSTATRHAIWRSDSRRLALLEIPAAIKNGAWPGFPWSGQGRGVGSSQLSVVDERGRPLVDTFVSDGALNVSPPRWTADGRWLIFTTCPLDGRRIVAVDIDHEVALDLSQPGWDAWAALLPRSGELLLHNGRGGLWRSRLRVLPSAP